jgi:hypothetical protein
LKQLPQDSREKQLGQSNKYNYNLLEFSRKSINTTANNTDLYGCGYYEDGTTTTPQNINWVGGYDGSPTTPISLARYWLYR